MTEAITEESSTCEDFPRVPARPLLAVLRDPFASTYYQFLSRMLDVRGAGQDCAHISRWAFWVREFETTAAGAVLVPSVPGFHDGPEAIDEEATAAGQESEELGASMESEVEEEEGEKEQQGPLQGLLHARLWGLLNSKDLEEAPVATITPPYSQ
jgi:hypothetical protein